MRAKMAGRTGGGEPGISLILAEDVTSLETHGPQQIHLPPKMRHKIGRVSVVSISKMIKVEQRNCVAFALCKTLLKHGKKWLI